MVQIDDDIYEFLQRKAIPLEDDVNSVLRRLLDLGSIDSAERLAGNGAVGASTRRRKHRKKSSGKGKRRALKGSILTEEAYEMPILTALAEAGGRAPTREVVDRVGEILAGSLTEADHEVLASGDVRWRNRAQFVRLSLVKKGDMKANSPRGVWEVTEAGLRRQQGSKVDRARG